MGAVTIFNNGSLPSNRKRELSPLAKSLVSATTNRRIQLNTNGTFKRIVNGEVVGKAIKGEMEIIVVNTLEKVSRVFYANEYDPDAAPAAPDCWSNAGDVPEDGAKNKQGKSCATCPQNVVGSGNKGKGRACRYQRRLAVVVPGDPAGDLYQFNVPAKSLFGKGVGNVHPFESYYKYLAANSFSLDEVVTKVAYNDEAETMELQFSPTRELTDEEIELVAEARQRPEAVSYTVITAFEADTAGRKPKVEVEAPAPKAKPKVQFSDEPEDDEEEVAPPIKRKRPVEVEDAEEVPTKSKLQSVISAWGDDD
jgi:hypothetical protein